MLMLYSSFSSLLIGVLALSISKRNDLSPISEDDKANSAQETMLDGLLLTDVGNPTAGDSDAKLGAGCLFGRWMGSNDICARARV